MSARIAWYSTVPILIFGSYFPCAYAPLFHSVRPLCIFTLVVANLFIHLNICLGSASYIYIKCDYKTALSSGLEYLSI